jgi:hypothetical protein
MMMKRIGSWPWALSRDERLAAAAIGRTQGTENPVNAKTRNRYGAMLVKQRKLQAISAQLQTKEMGT